MTNGLSLTTLPRDLMAGLVVFLVALPLCLGIALASNAPLFSGLLAGILGGIVVGALSGSQTSVSGPAAGLTAVVAAQIVLLDSFQTFLLALVLAGLIQIILGIARCGFFAAFFPSGVIKGLLAAIGLILILKQIPHVLGHDRDPEGELAFIQPDHETTFTELIRIIDDFHWGAAAIGLLSIAVLVVWERSKTLKRSPLPAPLFVVLFGMGLGIVFERLGGAWTIGASHLVQVPVADSLSSLLGFLQSPDFAQWRNPSVYMAAVTIAAVASLETLLNLEAIDRLDAKQRVSPPSRELVAQGIGNMIAGLIGGIPVTSVIIRSSVNIHAGGQTKAAAITHGLLLLICVVFLPGWLNTIPLSCLAAILLVTGLKLASPALVKQMWNSGPYQFIPFALTVAAIVLTDLLIGVLIGFAVSASFILWSNARRPIRRLVEKHLGGDVVRIELANQVSFLNRAALSTALDEVPRGGHILIDAQSTVYIDPDILTLLHEFKETTAPARGIDVSLKGFRSKYHLDDQIQYVDYSTRELQHALTPAKVLQILKDGNERFRSGRRLTRDLGRLVGVTARGQHPLAVVLGCIDSRTPAELIFDLGMGDVFVVRIAGNVTSRKVLGSIEYACAEAGAKLILVMGHTRCGAITAAVNLACASVPPVEATGCQHLGFITDDLQRSLDPREREAFPRMSDSEKGEFINLVARRNVLRVVETLRHESWTLDRLVGEERIAIVGALYDVVTGDIEFFERSDGLEYAAPEVQPAVAGET